MHSRKEVVSMREYDFGVADVLDCPAMKSGVHKWRIQVVEGKRHGLGVIVTCTSDVPLPLLDLDGFYRSKRGLAMFQGKAVHGKGNCTSEFHVPCKFRTGSIVSFSLDLDQGGILTASIDGDAPFEVFSDMCQRLDKEDGFLPAVDVSCGSVKFLGFEQDGIYC
jgi:hypothetical protein